jgi:hypothetical protein
MACLAGCGSTARTVTATNAAAIIKQAGAPGHLVGGIVYRGRAPSGGNNRYQRGWIEIGQRGHLVAKQHVERNRLYHFRLVPGTYDIAAYIRWGTCRDQATIRSHRTTVQDVYCVWH